MIPRSLQVVPVQFIGVFEIFHGLLASSYVWAGEAWAEERFMAMFSPMFVNDDSIQGNDFARGMLHFWMWFSALLGCLRLYAAAGILNQKYETIRMCQLSYVIESITYILLLSYGLANPSETFMPAYATIFGLIVMAFRTQPNRSKEC